MAIVEVQDIGLAVFEEFAVDQHEAIRQCGRDGKLAVHHLKIDLAMVPDIVGAVVRDVEVQGSVAVNIRKSGRDAAITAARTCFCRRVREMTMSVIEKAQDPAPGSGD